MNILNWLKSLLTRKNDEMLNLEIKRLNADIKTLKDHNSDLSSELNNAVSEMVYFRDELIKANKHWNIESYKNWSEKNIVPTATYYDFGSGKKQVHTIFAESVKDEDIIREFITTDMEFVVNPNWTVDQLIYWFNRRLSDKYPTNKYYAYDKDLYGVMEYWATAKETILKLRNGGKSFDCDDSMTLRYSCLYYLLKDTYPNELWRLRGFIVDIWTGGGHALLAWVKEGPNDWVPIETTFYDTKESQIWNGDYRIRDQMLYQIRYSFDNKHEYQKI